MFSFVVLWVRVFLHDTEAFLVILTNTLPSKTPQGIGHLHGVCKGEPYVTALAVRDAQLLKLVLPPLDELLPEVRGEGARICYHSSGNQDIANKIVIVLGQLCHANLRNGIDARRMEERENDNDLRKLGDRAVGARV